MLKAVYVRGFSHITSHCRGRGWVEGRASRSVTSRFNTLPSYGRHAYHQGFFSKYTSGGLVDFVKSVKVTFTHLVGYTLNYFSCLSTCCHFSILSTCVFVKMKTNPKLSRIKVNSDKAQRMKKPKNIAEIQNNSNSVLRRSIRISERQLQLHFSLPESDDSENEADDGAYDELQELSHCEDSDIEDDFISGCGEYKDDGNMSDDSLEDLQHNKPAKVSKGGDADWDCNTEYFDKLNKTFGDSPVIIGDIGQTEIDCFGSIFDDQVVSILVTETNRYAKQNNSKNWSDVTLQEMKAFIGCLIVMGIHQLPALKNYWSSDPFLRVEAVASVMTANRFKKIVENLHCNDNETQPPKSDPKFDKLHKVKPLLDILNEKCINLPEW